MRKILFLLTMLLVFIPVIKAKEIKLEGNSYNVKPGEEITLDIIIDAEEDFKSGSFTLVNTSKLIDFKGIKFENGIAYTVNGSKYTFEAINGSLKNGSKVATITLKASENTKDGATTTISINDLIVKSTLDKEIKLNSLKQVVSCVTNSKSNNLKSITSTSFIINNFSSSKLDYVVDVSTTNIKIDAEADDPKAKVDVIVDEFVNNTSKAHIKVTSVDGNQKEYTITLNLKEEKTDVIVETPNYNKKWTIILSALGILIFINLILVIKIK